MKKIKSVLKTKEDFDWSAANNIVRAENQDDAQNLKERNMAKRFIELNSDFRNRKRYTSKEYDKSAFHVENYQELNQKLVEQLMEENITLIETSHTTKMLKSVKKKKLDPKMEELKIKEMVQDDKKKKFEKTTTLMGVSTKQWVAIQNFEKFYKSRKNKGMGQIEKNKDIDIA